MADLTMEEFFSYFPTDYNQEVKNFAKQAIAKFGGDFIIFNNPNDREKAYCTHCGKNIVIPAEKVASPVKIEDCGCHVGYVGHSSEPEKTLVCPKCGYTLKYKTRRWKPEQHSKRALINYYAKSPINKKVVICRAIEVERKFTSTGLPVDNYRDVAWYLFRPKQKILMVKLMPEWHEYSWSHKKVFQEKINDYVQLSMNQGYYNLGFDTCYASFKRAIKNTHLEYCQSDILSLGEHYVTDQDNNLTYFKSRYQLIRYLDIFTKHPWVERAIKMGFISLIKHQINGGGGDYLNWRAGTFEKALRFKLTKDDRCFLSSPNRPQLSLSEFSVLQKFRLGGVNLPIVAAVKLAKDYYASKAMPTLVILYKTYGVTVERILRYKRKQPNQNKKGPARINNYNFIIDYTDYINDCLKENLDLHNKSNLFPENLQTRHMSLIKQIEINANREIEAKLIKTLPERNKLFSFQDEHYLIRPFQSIAEVIAEGRLQHNCVATYANRYAEKKVEILALRRIEIPNTPFVTVEIQINKQREYDTKFTLVQAREAYNRDISSNVRDFLREFLKHVNDIKTKKVRIKVA